MSKPLDLEHEHLIRAFLSGDPFDGEWDGRDQTEASLSAAMNAMAYWRERCEVTETDVDREGVTAEKRNAWLSGCTNPVKCKRKIEWMAFGVIATVTPVEEGDGHAAVTARVIRDLARGFGRSPWEILAETASECPQCTWG